MHRLFVETALLEQETLALPKEALNHLKVRGQIDAQKLYPVYNNLRIKSMHRQLKAKD